jgi:hypothetical protein
MSDLESRLKLKNISSHLMSIAVATNVVIEQIQEYASREVENTATCNFQLSQWRPPLNFVFMQRIRHYFAGIRL